MRTARALALGVVLAASGAGAFPQLQLSTAEKTCAGCHLAPAGGGILTEMGRTEAGDSLSAGGDGRFLHGLVTLPDWIWLGGDLRGAALVNQPHGEDFRELRLFPMQLDLRAKVGTDAFGASAAAGIHQALRDSQPREGAPVQPAQGPRVVSREHWLYAFFGEGTAYLRAGRFYAPFGLRLVDHTTFVRKFLGFSLLEETYGVSGGFVNEGWELHATAFASDPFLPPARPERGGALMGEVRFGPALLGASARYGVGDADARATLGLHGKWWWADARTMFLAQVSGVRQTFETGDPPRWQLAAYAGPVWMPVQWVHVGVAYELFESDVAVRATERHAASASVSIFPVAHLEVQATARVQDEGTVGRAAMGILQLHYYL